MYKAPLTATVFKDFSSCYQHFTSSDFPDSEQPFVYVDDSGVKLLTSVVDDSSSQNEEIFALSMAQDGWMEMLAMSDGR